MSQTFAYFLNDRFIPNRTPQNQYTLLTNTSKKKEYSSKYQNYIQHYFSNHKETLKSKKQFNTKSSAIHKDITEIKSQAMEVCKSAERILDAPAIKDDFYLNNLDWRSDGIVGIALNNQAFLYTPQEVVQICKIPSSSYISSLKFEEQIVSVGTSSGLVEIYDLNKIVLIRTINEHSNRVSVQTFINGNLITASKDRSILVHDLKSMRSVTKILNQHKGQICSLKQREKNSPILASGSNDNTIKIWDLRGEENSISSLKGHKAAVKGLDWCPWKTGYLASGGGSMDKSIKIWNTNTSNLMSSYQTKSQVSALIWNSKNESLISSHGQKQNQINIWKINQDGWKKSHCFIGHKRRILNMAISQDCNYICTTSADETIRFWKVNNHQVQKQRKVNKQRIL